MLLRDIQDKFEFNRGIRGGIRKRWKGGTRDSERLKEGGNQNGEGSEKAVLSYYGERLAGVRELQTLRPQVQRAVNQGSECGTAGQYTQRRELRGARNSWGRSRGHWGVTTALGVGKGTLCPDHQVFHGLDTAPVSFSGQPTLGEAESWEGRGLGSNLVLYGPGCLPSGYGQVAGGEVGWVSSNCPLLELLDRSSTCSSVMVALSCLTSGSAKSREGSTTLSCHQPNVPVTCG